MCFAYPGYSSRLPESHKGIPESKKIIREYGIALPECERVIPESLARIHESGIALPESKIGAWEWRFRIPLINNHRRNDFCIPESKKGMPERLEAISNSCSS